MAAKTKEQVRYLLDMLLSMAENCEWLEFKSALDDTLPRSLCAIANSLVVTGLPRGYLVFGVNVATRSVDGINFTAEQEKELRDRLAQHLSRPQRYDIHTQLVPKNGKRVVIIEIYAALDEALCSDGIAYFKNGTRILKLSESPEREKFIREHVQPAISQLQHLGTFEEGTARGGLDFKELSALLDLKLWAQLKGLPDERGELLQSLESARLIHTAGEIYSITNLGALLLSCKLSSFRSLAGKAPRLLSHLNLDKSSQVKEYLFDQGMLLCLSDLLELLCKELTVKGRKTGDSQRQLSYPRAVLQELLLNSIVHQNYQSAGSGMLVELFADKLVFSNPGAFPRARPNFSGYSDCPNPSLAARLRESGWGGAPGSGLLSVVEALENAQLPPLIIQEFGGQCRLIIQPQHPFATLPHDLKLTGVYQHCCLKYFRQEVLSNKSLRLRFGSSSKTIATFSRLLTEAVTYQLIKPAPESDSGSLRNKSYIPYWA